MPVRFTNICSQRWEVHFQGALLVVSSQSVYSLLDSLNLTLARNFSTHYYGLLLCAFTTCFHNFLRTSIMSRVSCSPLAFINFAISRSSLWKLLSGAPGRAHKSRNRQMREEFTILRNMCCFWTFYYDSGNAYEI